MQNKKNQEIFKKYLEFIKAGDVENFKTAIRKDKNLDIYHDENGKNIAELAYESPKKNLFLKVLSEHSCGKKLLKDFDRHRITYQQTKKTYILFMHRKDRKSDIFAQINLFTQNICGIPNVPEHKLGLPHSEKQKNLKTVRPLLAIDNKRNMEDVECIMIAIKQGDFKYLQEMINKKNIYDRNSEGMNALDLALNSKYTKAVSLISNKNRENFKKTSDLDMKKSHLYETASYVKYLKKAVKLGVFKERIRYLSEIINMNDFFSNNIKSFLFLIEQGKSNEIEDILYFAKIDINAADEKNEGKTPLHYAASVGNLKIVEILLKYGALNIPNKNGLTPIGIALKNGHNKVAQLIEEELVKRKADLLPLPELPPVEKSDDKALEGHAKNIDSLKLEIKGKIGDLESEILGGFSTLLEKISKSGEIKKYLSDFTHFIVTEKDIFLEKLRNFEKELNSTSLTASTSDEQKKIIDKLNQIKEELEGLSSAIKNKLALCNDYISHPDKLKNTSAAEILTQSEVAQKPKKKKVTTVPQKIKVKEKKKSHPPVREQQETTKFPERKINVDASSSRFFSSSLARAKRNLKIRKQKREETLNYAIELIEAFEKNVFFVRNNSKINPLSATIIRYLQESIIFSIVQSLRFRYGAEDRRAQQLDALRHVFISKRGKLDPLNDEDLTMLYTEFTQYIRDLWRNPRDVPILNEKGKLNHLMVETPWDLASHEETNILDLRKIISDEIEKFTGTQKDVPLVKKLLEDYLQKITNPMMKREDFSSEARGGLYKEKRIGDEKRHNQNYLADIHARFFTPREPTVSRVMLPQEPYFDKLRHQTLPVVPEFSYS